jgi:hypothetical protein
VNIALITARLSDVCPQFNLIGGAAEFERAQQGLTTVPAAFVVPAEESAAAENPFMDQITQQQVSADFAVVLAVRNVADGAGAAAVDELDAVRKPVRDALLGWQPDSEYFGCEFRDGRLLAFANGILWWADTYRTAYLIRSI